MKRPADRDGGFSRFPLPDVHLRKALWRLWCTVILSWGAWASVGGDWFTGAPVVLRAVMGVLFGAIALGMVGEAFSEWKKVRTRGAGPDMERIETPR